MTEFEQVKPLPWDATKSLILKYREKGIPQTELPLSLEVGPAILTIFDELQPILTEDKRELLINEYLGRLEQVISSGVGLEHCLEPEFLRERARAIKTDETGNKFLIHKQNQGESIVGVLGSGVALPRIPGAFGSMHNHPIDGNPSSQDVIPILVGDHVIEFIITPKRAILLAATTDAGIFRPTSFDVNSLKLSRAIATSYINEMGRKQGKLLSAKTEIERVLPESLDNDTSVIIQAIRNQIVSNGSVSALWELDFSDLEKLSIAAYVGKRGDSVLERKI